MHLPPEIWYYIFELATHVPGASCTTDQDAISSFTRDGYKTCSSFRIRRSVDLKLTISLVCSTWRCLVHRLLFQCLSITSGKQALQLVSLTGDNDPCGIKNTFRQTWWTVRLEFAIDGVHIWTVEHNNAVIQLLRRCPNLLCFSTIFSTADPYLFYSPTLVQALTKPEDKIKLKRIELKADSYLFKTVAMALADSLEVVWILSSRRAAPADSESYRLPRLHTYVSDAYHRGLAARADLPCLQTLISRDTPERISHILRNGATLRYLSVKDFDSSIPYLSLCPNLQALVLNTYDISRLRFNHIFEPQYHTHLETIIVENNDLFRLSLMGAGPHFAHRYLPRLLIDVSRQTFPALKRIRLIFFPTSPDYLDVFPVTLLSIWEVWLKDCSLQGISIEIVRDFEHLSANLWMPLTRELIQELL